jgi:choline dehydrogenase-like flavoprotein
MSLTAQYHPVGTCAMQPREKGGVVDSGLNVYGTSNLTIGDASIFPLQKRRNIQSTGVYNSRIWIGYYQEGL